MQKGSIQHEQFVVSCQLIYRIIITIHDMETAHNNDLGDIKSFVMQKLRLIFKLCFYGIFENELWLLEVCNLIFKSYS